jgi:hypothetical protein
LVKQLKLNDTTPPIFSGPKKKDKQEKLLGTLMGGFISQYDNRDVFLLWKNKTKIKKFTNPRGTRILSGRGPKEKYIRRREITVANIQCKRAQDGWDSYMLQAYETHHRVSNV